MSTDDSVDSGYGGIPAAVIDDAAWRSEEFQVHPHKRSEYARMVTESRQWNDRPLTVYRHVGDELARRLQVEIKGNPLLLTKAMIESVYQCTNDTVIPERLAKNRETVKLYALLHLEQYWEFGDKIRELYALELSHLRDELAAIEHSRTSSGKEFSLDELNKFSVKIGKDEEFQNNYHSAKGLNIAGYQKAILFCNRVDELMKENPSATNTNSNAVLHDDHAKLFSVALQAYRDVLVPGDKSKYGVIIAKVIKDYWEGSGAVLEEALRRGDAMDSRTIAIPH